MAILEKLSVHVDETSSKVYFTFVGDFCKNDITAAMKIAPTCAYTKGEPMQNGIKTKDGNPAVHGFSRWCYGTDYENTRDIEEQCDRVVAKLEEKIPAILSIIERYNCEVAFIIVPVIEKGKAPAFYLKQRVLNFCTAVKANIDIDIYANPYDESENTFEVDDEMLYNTKQED